MNRYARKEPGLLRDAISQFISERGLAGSAALTTLNELWKEIVGDDIGNRSKVLGLKNGTLEIGVRSSALLNELVGFYGQEFLELIQADERGRTVRNIKFRLKR